MSSWRRAPVRLVHTADVHLGSFGEPEAEREQRAAFTAVIQHVLGEAADLLLIAGDLFDSNRVDRELIDFVELELRRLRCPVVLIPGNHDCYDGDSVYRRYDFGRAGDHVHVLTETDGESLTLEEPDVVVWGKGLVEHRPGNRPMDGVPLHDGERWFIGMAHGYFVEDRRELRSSLITPDEIADSGLDYLALGHVHVFRDVSQGTTRACYPGAPRVPYSPGDGGIALVTLDPDAGVTIEERKLGG